MHPWCHSMAILRTGRSTQPNGHTRFIGMSPKSLLRRRPPWLDNRSAARRRIRRTPPSPKPSQRSCCGTSAEASGQCSTAVGWAIARGGLNDCGAVASDAGLWLLPEGAGSTITANPRNGSIALRNGWRLNAVAGASRLFKLTGAFALRKCANLNHG
jgi:hypothetical protein